MVSLIMTEYLRGLAERLYKKDAELFGPDTEQLVDLAITLDEEREDLKELLRDVSDDLLER